MSVYTIYKQYLYLYCMYSIYSPGPALTTDLSAVETMRLLIPSFFTASFSITPTLPSEADYAQDRTSEKHLKTLHNQLRWHI